MLHFKEHNQPAFDELAWAVRTGGNAWRKTHDSLSQFEWLQQDPKEEHKFSKAMQQVDGLGETPPSHCNFRLKIQWPSKNALRQAMLKRLSWAFYW